MKTTLAIITVFLSVSFAKVTTHKKKYEPVYDRLDIYRIQHNKDRVLYQKKLTQIIETQYKMIELASN